MLKTRIPYRDDPNGNRKQKRVTITGGFPSIRKGFESRGWINNDDLDSEDWDMKYTIRKKDINFSELKEWQVVNYYPTNHEFTTKISLTTNLQNLCWISDPEEYNTKQQTQQQIENSNSNSDEAMSNNNDNDEQKQQQQFQQNLYQQVDLDEFYPRCFNLSIDTQSFVEEFKRGKCLAILKSYARTESEAQQTQQTQSDQIQSFPTEIVEAAVDALNRRLLTFDICLEHGLGGGKESTVSTDFFTTIPDEEWNILKDVDLNNPSKFLETYSRRRAISNMAIKILGENQGSTSQQQSKGSNSNSNSNSKANNKRKKNLLDDRERLEDLLGRRRSGSNDNVTTEVPTSEPVSSDENPLLSRVLNTLSDYHTIDPQFGLYGEQNLWILKPAGKSRGRGIFVTNRLEEALDCARGQEALWMSQKYIENPQLVNCREAEERLKWVDEEVERWEQQQQFGEQVKEPQPVGELEVGENNNGIKKSGSTITDSNQQSLRTQQTQQSNWNSNEVNSPSKAYQQSPTKQSTTQKNKSQSQTSPEKQGPQVASKKSSSSNKKQKNHGRKKFDVRQWVLITNWQPLAVWFYNYSYLRFSFDDYDPQDSGNRYSHLTNYSIAKHAKDFEQMKNETMWDCDYYRDWMRFCCSGGSGSGGEGPGEGGQGTSIKGECVDAVAFWRRKKRLRKEKEQLQKEEENAQQCTESDIVIAVEDEKEVNDVNDDSNLLIDQGLSQQDQDHDDSNLQEVQDDLDVENQAPEDQNVEDDDPLPADYYYTMMMEKQKKAAAAAAEALSSEEFQQQKFNELNLNLDEDNDNDNDNIEPEFEFEDDQNQDELSPGEKRRRRARIREKREKWLRNKLLQDSNTSSESVQDPSNDLDFDLWLHHIQPKMKRIVYLALEACQERILLSDRKNCFELVGFDFMVDTDLNVWLIECNSSPDLSYSTQTTKNLVKEVLPDLVKVVLDAEKFGQKKRSIQQGLNGCIKWSKKYIDSLDTGGFELLYPEKRRVEQKILQTLPSAESVREHLVVVGQEKMIYKPKKKLKKLADVVRGLIRSKSKEDSKENGVAEGGGTSGTVGPTVKKKKKRSKSKQKSTKSDSKDDETNDESGVTDANNGDATETENAIDKDEDEDQNQNEDENVENPELDNLNDSEGQNRNVNIDNDEDYNDVNDDQKLQTQQKKVPKPRKLRPWEKVTRKSSLGASINSKLAYLKAMDARRKQEEEVQNQVEEDYHLEAQYQGGSNEQLLEPGHDHRLDLGGIAMPIQVMGDGGLPKARTNFQDMIQNQIQNLGNNFNVNASDNISSQWQPLTDNGFTISNTRDNSQVLGNKNFSGPSVINVNEFKFQSFPDHDHSQNLSLSVTSTSASNSKSTTVTTSTSYSNSTSDSAQTPLDPTFNDNTSSTNLNHNGNNEIEFKRRVGIAHSNSTVTNLNTATTSQNKSLNSLYEDINNTGSTVTGIIGPGPAATGIILPHNIKKFHKTDTNKISSPTDQAQPPSLDLEISGLNCLVQNTLSMSSTTSAANNHNTHSTQARRKRGVHTVANNTIVGNDYGVELSTIPTKVSRASPKKATNPSPNNNTHKLTTAEKKSQQIAQALVRQRNKVIVKNQSKKLIRSGTVTSKTNTFSNSNLGSTGSSPPPKPRSAPFLTQDDCNLLQSSMPQSHDPLSGHLVSCHLQPISKTKDVCQCRIPMPIAAYVTPSDLRLGQKSPVHNPNDMRCPYSDVNREEALPVIVTVKKEAKFGDFVKKDDMDGEKVKEEDADIVDAVIDTEDSMESPVMVVTYRDFGFSELNQVDADMAMKGPQAIASSEPLGSTQPKIDPESAAKSELKDLNEEILAEDEQKLALEKAKEDYLNGVSSVDAECVDGKHVETGLDCEVDTAEFTSTLTNLQEAHNQQMLDKAKGVISVEMETPEMFCSYGSTAWDQKFHLPDKIKWFNEAQVKMEIEGKKEKN